MAETAALTPSDQGEISTTPRDVKPASREVLQRSLLLAAAALAIGVAVAVTRSVIPPVRDIWVPHASGAEGAIPAFWASVIANVVFAGLLVLAAVVNGLRRMAVRWVLATLALGALVQSLMYLDAAAAFHGPMQAEMQHTTDWLRLLALTDAIAGVLVLVAALTSVRRKTVHAGDVQPG